MCGSPSWKLTGERCWAQNHPPSIWVQAAASTHLMPIDELPPAVLQPQAGLIFLLILVLLLPRVVVKAQPSGQSGQPKEPVGMQFAFQLLQLVHFL